MIFKFLKLKIYWKAYHHSISINTCVRNNRLLLLLLFNINYPFAYENLRFRKFKKLTAKFYLWIYVIIKRKYTYCIFIEGIKDEFKS